LREREERSSIKPLEADLRQRFDARSIRPLGGRRVDETVWPLHGVEDVPLDIGRRGRAEPDDPLASDTEIALGLHDPIGPPRSGARVAHRDPCTHRTRSPGARRTTVGGGCLGSRASARATRHVAFEPVEPPFPTCETSRSIAEPRRGVLVRACTPGPCPPSPGLHRVRACKEASDEFRPASRSYPATAKEGGR